MALEGTLKDFALPDIFQLIGLQKKTGTLVLKNEEDEVSISFKDGMLVSADSAQRRLEERLGTVLVRSQLITEGQLHDALEKQKQTFQRLGVILVNEGLIKQDDLRKTLELQTTQIIYRVFRWEDAYYRFDQQAEIDYDRENVVPIGAESILMEGMRIIDEWPLVEKVVRSMHGVYEKVPVDQPIEIEGAEKDFDEDDDFDFDLGGGGGAEEAPAGEERIVLSADEGRVYELLDGQRDVEEVMYRARMSEFDTCKAVYELLSRDLVRELVAPGVAGPAATAPGVPAAPAEASPVLVWAGTAIVFALVLAGLFFWRLNPVLASDNPFGLASGDVARQDEAAMASRLDRVAQALESHRLATGGGRYAEQLDDLVDLGLLRGVDIRNPWGVACEYTVVDEGAGFRLQGFDRDRNQAAALARVGGTAAEP